MLSKTTLYQKAASDPVVCKELLARIEATLNGRSLRFMEVCGTHTTALFQTGVKSLLPVNIQHISGPGCPVCVTHESEVAMFLNLAKEDNLTLTSYGDILRIPGPDGSSLKNAQAAGGRVKIVYSALDALNLAKSNPEKEIVFISVGFETTTPGVAAVILMAARDKVRNFSILNLHKRTPPVLKSLVNEQNLKLDAFLLPGHVATITGLEPFRFLPERYGFPAAVAGFEAADMLLALFEIAEQVKSETPKLVNAYPRAVNTKGNPRAKEIMERVFEEAEALWRGLGIIEASGFKMKDEFADYDAMKKYQLALPEISSPNLCQCGNILKGKLSPLQCPLFGKSCTPGTPVGPCMVSTEGSCAAYYRYGAI